MNSLIESFGRNKNYFKFSIKTKYLHYYYIVLCIVDYLSTLLSS